MQFLHPEVITVLPLRAGVVRATALLSGGLVLCLLLSSSAGALSLRPRELVRSGAWCWFGDPRAVYHAGAHRRTYVGWVDAAGSIHYPVQLSAEGNRIWLFWRGGNFNPTFSSSSDEVSWAPARTLVSVPGSART